MTRESKCDMFASRMRVSDFDELDHFETEGLLTGSKERNWLWLGLIVSLAMQATPIRSNSSDRATRLSRYRRPCFQAPGKYGRHGSCRLRFGRRQREPVISACVRVAGRKYLHGRTRSLRRRPITRGRPTARTRWKTGIRDIGGPDSFLRGAERHVRRAAYSRRIHGRAGAVVRSAIVVAV